MENNKIRKRKETILQNCYKINIFLKNWKHYESMFKVDREQVEENR